MPKNPTVARAPPPARTPTRRATFFPVEVRSAEWLPRPLFGGVYLPKPDFECPVRLAIGLPLPFITMCGLWFTTQRGQPNTSCRHLFTHMKHGLSTTTARCLPGACVRTRKRVRGPRSVLLRRALRPAPGAIDPRNMSMPPRRESDGSLDAVELAQPFHRTPRPSLRLATLGRRATIPHCAIWWGYPRRRTTNGAQRGARMGRFGDGYRNTA